MCFALLGYAYFFIAEVFGVSFRRSSPLRGLSYMSVAVTPKSSPEFYHSYSNECVRGNPGNSATSHERSALLIIPRFPHGNTIWYPIAIHHSRSITLPMNSGRASLAATILGSSVSPAD